MNWLDRIAHELTHDIKSKPLNLIVYERKGANHTRRDTISTLADIKNSGLFELHSATISKAHPALDKPPLRLQLTENGTSNLKTLAVHLALRWQGPRVSTWLVSAKPNCFKLYGGFPMGTAQVTSHDHDYLLSLVHCHRRTLFPKGRWLSPTSAILTEQNHVPDAAVADKYGVTFVEACGSSYDADKLLARHESWRRYVIF